jgi:sulfonate transport system substrate-binding protein
VRARLIQYGLLPSGGRGAGDGPTSGTAPPLRPAIRAPRVLRVAKGRTGLLAILKATGALDEGLAARDAQVEWIECETGMQVVAALSSGRADVGMVGEAPPVFAQAARAPVVYLAAEPPKPEGEAIVVHHDSTLDAVGDLRGKALALAHGANVLYFVLRALEEAGVGLDELTLSYLPPSAARAAFERREVAAWAIWDAHLSSVQREGRARVLRDARGLAPNRAFYVGRRAVTEAQPDLVDVFLTEAGAAGRWANESHERAARLLAPHVDIAPASLEADLGRTRFALLPLDGEILAAQQRIADTLHRFRLIAEPVDVSQAVWSPPWAARRSA